MPETKDRPFREGAAQRFGREIREARDKGLPLGGLVLRLTLSDSSQIKRDPQIALEDVSFAEGAMSYLGVEVMQGGVRFSELIPREGLPVVEAEAAPVKPKRAKAVKKPKAPVAVDAAAADAAKA